MFLLPDYELLKEAYSVFSMTANTIIKLREAKIKRELMKDKKPKNCFPCIVSDIQPKQVGNKIRDIESVYAKKEGSVTITIGGINRIT